MQQSDYLMREIEKISIMLLGMMGKLRRRKKEGVELNEDEYSSLCNEIVEESTLNIEVLLQTESSEFTAFFRNDGGFNDENIEVLADVIKSMSDVCHTEKKILLLTKARDIYGYLDTSTKSFSLDRMNKIKTIEEQIKTL